MYWVLPAGAGILCALTWPAGFATVYAVTCRLACIFC